MFIELAEFLRCPERHDPATYCVLVPHEMVGRSVVTGTVACPVCEREYPIRDGVALFGAGEPPPPAGAAALPAPHVVQALLGLGGPGGYVVLVGSAVPLAGGLAELMGGVHFVGINPPPDLGPSPLVSLLRHADRMPLQSGMARGVVVGAECCRAPWLDEGARVLLRGLRLVALRASVSVAGLEPMAAGRGMWVGEKR